MRVFVRQRLSGRNDRARTVKTDYNASSIKGRNLTLTGIELKKGVGIACYYATGYLCSFLDFPSFKGLSWNTDIGSTA